MNERIQRALDGEIARERLTPEEAGELAAYEQAIHDAVEVLSPARTPDLAASVMNEIGTALPGESQFGRCARRVLAWMWAPRPLAVRPAYAFLAALLVVGLWVAAGTGIEPTATSAVAGDRAGPQVFVHFRIDAPDAAQVQLAGDFSGWQPAYTLHESAPGVWSVVVPIEPGVHHYAFVIDGEEWVADPHAPRVDDGFGGTNSRLAVLIPERREAT